MLARIMRGTSTPTLTYYPAFTRGRTMLAGFRRSARLVANHLQDAWLGISTTGTAPAELPGHVYYATVSYSTTWSVLRKLDLGQEDVFVDVGCGKGRVLCLAARHRIRQAIGIEYSPALAAAGQRNIRQLRGRRSPAKILCQAAEDSDYSDASVLYFFNPFEAHLLNRVLEKIRADRRGRPARMAFVMESQEQRKVFSRHSWLACDERFEDQDRHTVALYRSVGVDRPDTASLRSTPPADD